MIFKKFAFSKFDRIFLLKVLLTLTTRQRHEWKSCKQRWNRLKKKPTQSKTTFKSKKNISISVAESFYWSFNFFFLNFFLHISWLLILLILIVDWYWYILILKWKKEQFCCVNVYIWFLLFSITLHDNDVGAKLVAFIFFLFLCLLKSKCLIFAKKVLKNIFLCVIWN